MSHRSLIHVWNTSIVYNADVRPPDDAFWGPARRLGGLSLLIAPCLVLIGELLRLGIHFYFPQQLAAYASAPVRITASYSSFVLGVVLVWPGILVLAALIGMRKPGWGWWGGGVTMVGVMTRVFHEGVNHQAFQIVDTLGLAAATEAVTDSYGAFYVLGAGLLAIPLGWFILGFGAYRAGVLGWLPALLLAQMGVHSNGVLKGSDWGSVITTLGWCLALVPLGLQLLRSSRRTTTAMPDRIVVQHLKERESQHEGDTHRAGHI